MSEHPTTVVGIPGKWVDRSTIVDSIVQFSGEYIFAGMVLMNTVSKWSCNLEIYEHDPHLSRSFEMAGGGRFATSQLNEIENHTFVLYLSCEGGSIDNAQALMHAANALLDCGGLGVKVESTGIAHTEEGWRALNAAESPTALMHAFVTYIGGAGKFYSCGMHNIGFRDSQVTADIPPNDAANLLFTLNAYTAFEGAVINDGETFSVSPEAPYFRVYKKPCEIHPVGDLFHNPYGMWDLAQSS